MSQPFQFLKFTRTAIILCLAALYCLAPLQKPLMDGFHKLEHVILNTNSNHTHEESHHIDSPHTHEHKALSYFKNLFSEDTENSETLTKEFKLDKHLIKKFSFDNPIIIIPSKKTFGYTIKSYSVIISSTLPPPKIYFS